MAPSPPETIDKSGLAEGPEGATPRRAFRHLNAQPELLDNAIGGKDLCPMPLAESLWMDTLG